MAAAGRIREGGDWAGTGGGREKVGLAGLGLFLSNVITLKAVRQDTGAAEGESLTGNLSPCTSFLGIEAVKEPLSLYHHGCQVHRSDTNHFPALL